MSFIKLLRVAVAVCGIALLAACDSSEEQAEEHYQSALELLQAGDVERAIVELRNVFQLNGQHKEARRTMAETELERGRIGEAYSQYLRLVEQYPDDFEAQLALSRIALDQNNWEEVEQHIEPALELEPQNPEARLIKAASDYKKAVEAESTTDLDRIRKEVEQLQPEVPSSTIPHKIAADAFAREGKYDEALKEIEAAIALDPDDFDLYQLRLALTNEIGDAEAVEKQLLEMVGRFPDRGVPATLMRWYLSRGEIDKAEAFMRKRADEIDDQQSKLELVQFLTKLRGPEAAIAEAERFVAEGENPDLFRSIRAGLQFSQGEREAAIAEIESILETAQPSEQTRDIKIGLARMLLQTGNEVGARALVEEVLADDPTQVEALKLRASWLIDGDKPDEAIATLRTALDQSPRDPDIMTLMARAYERSGSRELAGEMLSLAVEASNRAPAESLRYAQFLVQQDKLMPAESVLIDALRLQPSDLGLLRALGAIYVRQKDWPRAQQVADTLDGFESDEAKLAGAAIEAEVLAGQNRTGEVVDLLKSMVEEGEGGTGAKLAIIKTYVENGDTDSARTYLDAALAATPDDLALQFAKGALLELTGDVAGAEAAYRDIVDDEPAAVRVWQALLSLEARSGDAEGAQATLDEALAKNPESADLQWVHAGLLQQRGKIDEAIAIYEDLYERNSNSPIIANNLATLLATHRGDQASIERAYSIARRLKGVSVPAFQDTYGWLAYLRGEYGEARAHLEPAAAALTTDPSVQYHLGMLALAQDRRDEAIEQFRKAVALRDVAPLSPEVGKAAEELERLGESK